ncbi:hypothetical protein Nepgr_014718 [Nepenthes gracilis]|uniref:Uncharacterized protein n=1 Tax=Nepenthes gracilis TaxID=150966 RepID=A0AAD3SKJ3_NEPGR|nr:hypothetical protein Nepgr_014718 [Nepenthes gracilis]
MVGIGLSFWTGLYALSSVPDAAHSSFGADVAAVAAVPLLDETPFYCGCYCWSAVGSMGLRTVVTEVPAGLWRTCPAVQLQLAVAILT